MKPSIFNREIDTNKLVAIIIENTKKFEELEPRGYIYRISRELIESKWDNDWGITEAICILLHVWNGAFYRYGFFDIDRLKDWITKNKSILNELKDNEITIDRIKETKYALVVKKVFDELIEVTKIKNPNKKHTSKFLRTPVGVAKTLHLLLPNLFPLWDDAIAKGMKTVWNSKKQNYSEKYLECCLKTLNLKNKIMENQGVQKLVKDGKSALKIIDELNYIYFTKEKKKGGEYKIYPELNNNEVGYIESVK